MIRDSQDAFGHAILDYFEGRNMQEAASFGCRTWFSDYQDWFERERKAIQHAKGRVLDVGCAAGRHALYLQARGHEVFAIDNSPLAIRVCKRRGVRHAKVIPATRLSSKLGSFDTILMLGNNFGLVGNIRRGRWLLRRLNAMTPRDGVIIAGSGDHAANKEARFKARVAQNRKQGRLPGEFNLRPRFRSYVSAPIKWLYASKRDMLRILDGTGWEVKKFFDDKPPSGAFVALIEKRNCRTKASSRRDERRG